MENPDFNLATIGEVFSDGVSLIFDGQTQATEKHYKCNTSINFKAGDRVKILKDSGTYIVEYIVGNPKADSGGGGSSAPQDKLVNGNSSVWLAKNGFFCPGTDNGVYLGASNFAWKGLWANGTVYLGKTSGSKLSIGNASATMGFFGANPISRPTVSDSAPVAQLITALKNLGLIG